MGFIGSEGFIAWLYVVTWKMLQDFSKKIYGKYITHSIGLLFMILGLIPIIKLMNPVLIFIGIALLLAGIALFSIPFFATKEK